MPSAAAETTRKPREGKEALSNMTSSCSLCSSGARIMRGGAHPAAIGARFEPGFAARSEMPEGALILVV
jgi:hypothetical protein